VPAASERRVVTVVFADLAGSTELAARLDPERFREVLGGFHGMVSDEIGGLGGVAEVFIGDAVLGVFGTPVARDDDALRGIRAAVRIVERARDLGTELGLAVPIQVRVGVNTGRVAVGTAADRNLVIGAEVNVGARLQQAAAPGEILAGATTNELTRSHVEFGPVRMIPAKGFDAELPTWPVVRVLPSTGRSDRSQLPIVDRRRELALLADTFDRVHERERAHLVTLLGEPGIGKSRVAEEFIGSLPTDVEVLVGRSSAFEEAVTFWPLAQMLYRLVGVDRSTPEPEVLERLDRSVAAWVGPDEVDRVVRSLAFAMGLGEPGNEDNRYHAAEVRRGVLEMLAGLGRTRPVVMVFEDLQEADPLLHDVVEQLVRDARRVPLLVVAVARWDFLEERASWAGGIADAVTLWVEPLSESHAVQLAMESGGLDRDDAERVARHAGGNPLFIVEITAMLLRDERDLPPATLAPSGRLLPPTVQAVIAARIDHLSPGARELVRRASVFPRGTFDLDELELIVEPRNEWLAEAEDEEILLRDEERPRVWRFRSDALRDVAYETLAKRERQRLHVRVANRLSEPEVARRYPRTIGFHLEQAARASLDLNPRDRTLAERAVEALARAGDIARRRIESGSAADLYERALSLAGPEERWGAREGWIVSMLGEARYWLGEFDAADEALRRALAIASEAQDDRVVAHSSRFLADVVLTIEGDDHLAAALFDRSLEAARRIGDPSVLARTLLMAGWVPYWRSDLAEAERLFREALDVTRSADRRDAWVESRALVGLSTVVAQGGDEHESLELGMEALVVAEESGQSFTTAIAHEAVASSLRRLLRLDEALEHADQSARVLRELGARWELAGALGDRGSIHRLAGRLDEAEHDLREAFVLCRALEERSLVSWTASELARVLIRKGDVSGARAVLDDRAARVSDREPGSAAARRAAEAALALAEGDRDAALATSTAALEGERGPLGTPTTEAALVWWTGTLFGPETVGGPAALDAARDRLEAHGRHQALLEPDLVLQAR
jgi:class 3 adenylate cyclase/tetratricopeptide (TPR) repeat protein